MKAENRLRNLTIAGLSIITIYLGMGYNIRGEEMKELRSRVSQLEQKIEVNHKDVTIDASTQEVPDLTVLTYPNGTQYAIAPSRNPNTGEVTCAEFKLNPHGNLPRWYH